jgi:hypothetical protein
MPSTPLSEDPSSIFSFHLRPGLPSGYFPHVSLKTPLLSPIRTTCPAHLILFDLITRTILGEGYGLCVPPRRTSYRDLNWLWQQPLLQLRRLYQCQTIEPC